MNIFRVVLRGAPSVFLLARAMAVTGGAGDTQEDLVARLDAAIRGHDRAAFEKCVNFDAVDEVSRKALSALEDHILKEPQAVVALSWIGDRKEFPAPGKDELGVLNGVFSSMVTVGASRFCTGMVGGRWMILLPVKLSYGKTVPGKPGYVVSPYDAGGHPLDARGLPHGIVMKDPATGRPFLVPWIGGKDARSKQGDVELAFGDSSGSARVYQAAGGTKPWRADVDTDEKLNEIWIYLARHLMTISPAGEVKEVRRYRKDDFFDTFDGNAQLQAEEEGK